MANFSPSRGRPGRIFPKYIIVQHHRGSEPIRARGDCGSVGGSFHLSHASIKKMNLTGTNLFYWGNEINHCVKIVFYNLLLNTQITQHVLRNNK